MKFPGAAYERDALGIGEGTVVMDSSAAPHVGCGVFRETERKRFLRQQLENNISFKQDAILKASQVEKSQDPMSVIA